MGRRGLDDMVDDVRDAIIVARHSAAEGRKGAMSAPIAPFILGARVASTGSPERASQSHASAAWVLFGMAYTRARALFSRTPSWGSWRALCKS